MRLSRILAAGLLAVTAISTQAVTVIHNFSGYQTTDTALLQFSAMAFDQGKVLETGNLTALDIKYPKAKKIDAGGKTLLPGLVDAHGHMLGLGQLNTMLDLRDQSLKDTLQSIKQHAKSLEPGEWLLGRGWNQVTWPGKQFPTRAQLDTLELNHPIWLRRVDGHAGWANSKALQLANISKNTQAPEGGEILRDSKGKPTGILIDNAMSLLQKAIPSPTLTQEKKSLQNAFSKALTLGLTSVHDAGINEKTLNAYSQLAVEDAIPIRVYPMLSVDSHNYAKLLRAGHIGTPAKRLYMRSIKLSADGALGSRGAALIEPYHDRPREKGLLLYPETKMLALLKLATDNNFQVNVHAIGDRANHIVLNHLETLNKAKSQKEHRHRVEHAQVIELKDIPRFTQLNLIASMQPTHATSDKNMAGDRLGEERLTGAYAWKTLLKQGTPIAAGSDFPVEPANPLFGLHAAITRRDRQGNPSKGWRTEEAMTLEQALRAFTLDAAYASHQEQVIGTLEPGKFADFILLDRNIFEMNPQEVWQAQVLETWVEGERVYRKAL
ncbi:amidohydrolase [Microbulbifer sp. OS29]|uniref:Amidohydrolase n=1 Tax=Microbulbifer okhotskensis TaxID=2926617 RepID=A0A9X2ETW4_9GAMM|nr:amidohydrolase [Microbulbifer okhotskensis]MCO1335706.1 amidohydrolase [Microbulbifer okhotskensis]